VAPAIVKDSRRFLYWDQPVLHALDSCGMNMIEPKRLRGRLKALWTGWFRGFEDQNQLLVEADLIAEYDRACVEFGIDSDEALHLKGRVDEIYARREAANNDA
jgi:hypothetical protein